MNMMYDDDINKWWWYDDIYKWMIWINKWYDK